MSIDTPNSQKQKKRENLAADVERFLAKGNEIRAAENNYREIARGPDKMDFLKSASAAALLGFSQIAIKQSFRTDTLGGHPAPEWIRHTSGHPVFMREAIYQWVAKYGKGGVKTAPKKEATA